MNMAFLTSSRKVSKLKRSKDATRLRLRHTCGRGLASDSISELTIPTPNVKRNVALKARYWLLLELHGVSVGTYSPRDERSKTGYAVNDASPTLNVTDPKNAVVAWADGITP